VASDYARDLLSKNKSKQQIPMGRGEAKHNMKELRNPEYPIPLPQAPPPKSTWESTTNSSPMIAGDDDESGEEKAEKKRSFTPPSNAAPRLEQNGSSTQSVLPKQTPADELPIRSTPGNQIDTVALQRANGSWNIERVANLLNISTEKLKIANPFSKEEKGEVEELNDAWATAVALAYLEAAFADTKNLWGLVSRKGTIFLTKVLAKYKKDWDLTSDAAKFVKKHYKPLLKMIQSHC